MKRIDWFPWTLVAVLLLAGYGYRGTIREQSAEVTRLTAVADSLRTLSARVDTIYRDSLKPIYKGWRDRWDTARVAHLERLLDSARSVSPERPDTVPVTVPLSVLTTADSTIEACHAVVLSCEERVRLRDARLAIVSDSLPRALNAVWESRLRAERQRTRKALGLGVGVGALACALLCR